MRRAERKRGVRVSERDANSARVLGLEKGEMTLKHFEWKQERSLSSSQNGSNFVEGKLLKYILK